MANLKNGFIREIIIDRCLKSRRGYSTIEIMDKCNEVLENRGEMPITASNTIRNDILSIENRWNIIVEQIRNGRNICYRYKDPEFSIYNSPFTEEEINSLTKSVSVLKRFEGMDGFEWVDELNARIKSTVNVNAKSVIDFDTNRLLRGMEYFTPIFNYIVNNQTIMIEYRPYTTNDIKKSIVCPYYLKEYNQRWFLLGLNLDYGDISNYALDRIISINESTAKYIKNTKYDFKHYFDQVIGVSIDPIVQEQEIILQFSSEQWKYTSSKPLHSSQKVIKILEDGSAIISIKVKPNFELMQLLLSFGENVIVLSPDRLKQEIIHRIQKNIENYK